MGYMLYGKYREGSRYSASVVTCCMVSTEKGVGIVRVLLHVVQ